MTEMGTAEPVVATFWGGTDTAGSGLSPGRLVARTSGCDQLGLDSGCLAERGRRQVAPKVRRLVQLCGWSAAESPLWDQTSQLPKQGQLKLPALPSHAILFA